MDATQRVGEVIEASTTGFVAQCYELYQPPPLGSLVKTANQAMVTYAIVYHATTTSLEPGRRPIARGRDETNEEAIYQSSPQLTQLLRSEFSALVVGYRENDSLYRHLPPKPTRIHAFVHQCSPEEVKEFSQSLDFLNILINIRLPLASDELIAACLRQMSQVYPDPNLFLVAAGKELALRLSSDYNQLITILERIKS